MAVLAAGAASAQHSRFRFQLNLGTAIIGGLIGFVIGFRIGMALGYAGADNQPLFFGYILGTIGYFVGLGFFNPVFRWLLGRPAPTGAAQEYLYGYEGGVSRYFRLTLDHKVIGIQYLDVDPRHVLLWRLQRHAHPGGTLDP